MTPARTTGLRGWLALTAAVAVLASAVGLPVAATRRSQVAADEPQYLLTALSLAEDGDLDIADELADGRWRDFHAPALPEQTRPLPGGRRISPHDPLLPVLLAPAMAVGGWRGAKVLLAVFAGLVAALTCWTAVRRFGVPAPLAGATSSLFAASAPLAVYGTQVYPEMAAALAVMAAVAALTGPLRAGPTTVVGVAVAALPWLATKYVPVAATLAAIALWRLAAAGRRRHAVLLGGALALAAVAFLAGHQVLYGGWTPYATGDHFVGGEFTVVGTRPNLLGRSRRLAGLLVDRRFGLAAWQPAWLLLVAAVAALLRRRPPGWGALLLPLAGGWLTATFVALTMHGWWFPGRQVVVVLPLGVVAIAWWAARGPRRVATLAVSALVGVWSYAWLVAQGRGGELNWIVDFAATRDPLHRVWVRVLPDGMRAATGDLLLDAVWSLALGALAVVAWRAAAPGSGAGRLLDA